MGVLKNLIDENFNKTNDVGIEGGQSDILCDGLMCMHGFSAVVDNTIAVGLDANYTYDDLKEKEEYIENCISSGVTKIFDISSNYILSAKAYKRFCIDVCIAVHLFPQDNINQTTIAQKIEDVVKENNSVEIALSIDDALLYNEEQILEIVKYSKTHNKIIYVPASSTLDDVGECDKTTTMSPIYYLESLGILDRRCIIGGCTYIDKDEAQLLANYGAKVCLFLSKNLQKGEGIAPVYSMLKQNVDLCMGLYEYCLPDVLREMFLFTHLQEGVLNMQKIVTQNQTLAFAQNNIFTKTSIDTNPKPNSFVLLDISNLGVVSGTNFVDYLSLRNVVAVVKNNKICYSSTDFTVKTNKN